MLKLYETFKGTSVLSLRTGGAVGYVVEIIVNPNNLYVEGWFVEDSRSKETYILLTQNIRDIIPQGIVINDHEDLSEPDELVRLQEILALNFSLSGMKVQSQNGKNYGKVTDYAFDTLSYYVQKIYATQAIVRNLAGGNTSIDRSQIVEITNKRIIVEDPVEKLKKSAPYFSPVS